MNTEQERAEFEAWAQDKTELYQMASGDYSSRITRLAWRAYQAGRAALQSQEREDTFCVWHNDPETDNSWDTGCRQLFEIYDGTPTENGMGFCCYCGKPIREAMDHARRVEGDNDAAI